MVLRDCIMRVFGMHWAHVMLPWSHVVLHRVRGIYAVYAAYGWGPRILRIGSGGGKVLLLGPVSQITDSQIADI